MTREQKKILAVAVLVLIIGGSLVMLGLTAGWIELAIHLFAIAITAAIFLSVLWAVITLLDI